MRIKYVKPLVKLDCYDEVDVVTTSPIDIIPDAPITPTPDTDLSDDDIYEIS